jgi:membrane associated rhomboid family serine protease
MNRKTPPATAALIAINVAVCIFALPGSEKWVWLLERFDLYAPAVIDGEYWRLLSYMFLHGSLPHIAMNMIALWQLGSITEQLWGTRRFLLIYLLTGLLGAGVSLLARELGVTSIAAGSVGASGAIFGIDGAILGLIWARSRSNEEFKQNPFVRSAAFNGFILFALAFAGMRIDHFAHLGGLLGGGALALLWPPKTTFVRPEPKKRRLALIAIAVTGAALVYSLYPIGAPNFNAPNKRATDELFERGLAAARDGDFVSCAAAFEGVLEADPEALEAAYNLVLCEKRLDAGRARERARYYEELLEARPGLERPEAKAKDFRELRESIDGRFPPD